MTAIDTLSKIMPKDSAETHNIEALQSKCKAAMDDDFNTPVLIASLFEGVKLINNLFHEKASITSAELEALKKLMRGFTVDVLGLKLEEQSNDHTGALDAVMHVLLDLRKNAKEDKNWALADQIREGLNEAGITVKDSKDGAVWEVE